MNPAIRHALLGCVPAAVLLGTTVSPAGAQTCGPPDFRVSLTIPQFSPNTRAAPDLPATAAAPSRAKRESGKHLGAGGTLAATAGVVASAAIFLAMPGESAAGARASPAALGVQRGLERRTPLPVPPLFPSAPQPVGLPGGVEPPDPIVPLVRVPPLLPGGPGQPGTPDPPGSGVAGRTGFTGPVALNPEPGAALLFLPGLLGIGLALRRRPL
jgi:hypothetical protein